MKILLLGEATKGSRSNSYCSAFKELGCEVYLFDWRDYFRLSFFNRVLIKMRKTPLYLGAHKINRSLLKVAKEYAPDFMLLFKPILIFSQTIRVLASSTRVFSWYPDDIFWPKNASTHFYRAIPFYHCHFTTKSFNVAELKDAGAQDTVFLPHAADPHCHYPMDVTLEEEQAEGSDLVFVGSWENDRAQILERLCRDGYNIKIYGNRWQMHPPNSCLRRKKCIRFKEVYCEDMARVLNTSKIALAFLRKHNRDVQTGRTYEIPACKAFMLHERTDEVCGIFREGEEFEGFSSYEELKKKIDFYLKNDSARQKIAENGHVRVMEGGHLIKNRAQVILDYYQRSISENN